MISPKQTILRENQRTTYIHMAIIIAVGMAFTLPAFFSNFFSGNTVLAHLHWSNHFAKQFWSGELYPRWLIDMNAGHGSPVFFYYFPLPYFITSVFHAPVFNIDPYGWLQLGLSTALALVLSGLGAYVWLGNLVSKNSAAIAAILYMLMPYHLLIDLYGRFAFTEFWAFVWMPIILYFMKGIDENRHFSAFGFALCYSMLIMTHLPTTLVFSIIPIFYVLLISRKKVNAAIKILSSTILGIGLSSIYFVPAMFTQDHVRIKEMTKDLFYYKNNFIFTSINSQPEEAFNYLLLISETTVILMAIGLLSYFTINIKPKKSIGLFWLLIASSSTLMMTDVSSIIYEIFHPLQKIQFPYRFNTILTLSVTALLALAIDSLKYKITIKQKSSIVVIFGLLISQMSLSIYTIHKHIVADKDSETEQTIIREHIIATDVIEYRPRWASETIFSSIAASNPEKGYAKVRFTEGDGSAMILLWQPRKIILQTRALMPTTLIIRQFYYPGWSAQITGDSRQVDIRPSESEGLLSIGIPAGTNNLTLTLKAGAEETIGRILSILSLSIITFLSVRRLIVEQRCLNPTS